jgi:hypothetical protein
MQPNIVHWRKSTASSATDCVEVAFVDAGRTVCVRDSKAPDAAMLRFTRREWAAFLEGVRLGEFDD